MPSFLRRWRWRHLFASWAAYWAGLGLVVLWQPVSIARRLAELPDGAATISAEVTNGTFSIQILEHGATVWAASGSLLAVVLWIAGPPLLLWLTWASSRSHPAVLADPETSLGLRAESDADRPKLRDGIAFADHLADRRPRRENVGLPRDRDAR